jgi:hypothetical protein
MVLKDISSVGNIESYIDAAQEKPTLVRDLFEPNGTTYAEREMRFIVNISFITFNW